MRPQTDSAVVLYTLRTFPCKVFLLQSCRKCCYVLHFKFGRFLWPIPLIIIYVNESNANFFRYRSENNKVFSCFHCRNAFVRFLLFSSFITSVIRLQTQNEIIISFQFNFLLVIIMNGDAFPIDWQLFNWHFRWNDAIIGNFYCLFSWRTFEYFKLLHLKWVLVQKWTELFGCLN